MSFRLTWPTTTKHCVWQTFFRFDKPTPWLQENSRHLLQNCIRRKHSFFQLKRIPHFCTLISGLKFLLPAGVKTKSYKDVRCFENVYYFSITPYKRLSLASHHDVIVNKLLSQIHCNSIVSSIRNDTPDFWSWVKLNQSSVNNYKRIFWTNLYWHSYIFVNVYIRLHISQQSALINKYN